MPLKSLFAAAVLVAGAATLATPAAAGHSCAGACDAHVTVVEPAYRPQIVVDRARPLYTRRTVRRHAKRTHRVRRSHARRSHVRSHVRRIPRLAPQHGPVHMRGRTRFCSDHLTRRGHKLIRECVQIRNDLLGGH